MKRAAAVAGLFYPAEPAALQAQIDALLDAAAARASGEAPKALIGPHAGTAYSGAVAATGYAHFEPARQRVRRVVLLGPSHRLAFSGLAAATAEAFATPIGDVRVDRAALAALVGRFEQVRWLDEAHRREHSLELHLPFLCNVFNDIEIIPLVVGDASDEDVAAVVDHLWGGAETAFVVSSDLSHFHDEPTARRLDRETSYDIERLRYERLTGAVACGHVPMRGLLLAAARRAMRARVVDLRTSADAGGRRDQVVGYGSYILH